MPIKDSGALNVDNDALYDQAIALTTKVNSVNQKAVTKDQVESFVNKKDRVLIVVAFPTPLAIVLNYTSVEHVTLDLTSVPGTTSFDITSILGLVIGQRGKLTINKNANQAIVITGAQGLPILLDVNKLEMMRMTSATTDMSYGNIQQEISGSKNIPTGQLVESDGEILIDSSFKTSDFPQVLLSGTMTVGDIAIIVPTGIPFTGGFTAASKEGFAGPVGDFINVTATFADIGTSSYIVLLNIVGQTTPAIDSAIRQWTIAGASNTGFTISISESEPTVKGLLFVIKVIRL